MAGADRAKELQKLQSSGFPWESPHVYYTVREPFPSRATQASLVFGRIESPHCLRLTSQMPDYGVIFSDGVEQDFLEFNSGVTAEIGVARRVGNLVQ
jgi:hypothetical protein